MPPPQIRRLRSTIALAAGLLAACASAAPQEIGDCGPSRLCTVRVVNRFPHDPAAFTQGLTFADGHLYEGTGLHGESTLRKVELQTGRVVQQLELEPAYFGEGIALLDDRIVQLTFTSGVGFVYQREGFVLLDQFSYSGEGWGITHDGRRLIMSDGTNQLRLLDPRTFAELDRISVTDRASPVERLNELEYIQGQVFANVWQTDRIARISPETGEVLSWIDLTGLLGAERFEPGVDVLNGIAYDAEAGRLFVTGKRWPWLFEVELIPADGP